MNDIELSNLRKRTRLPFSYIRNNSFEPSASDANAYEELESIREDIVDFVKKGRCLYLGSHIPGNGKTSWAVRLGSEFFKHSLVNPSLRIRNSEVITPVFYINVPDYLVLRKNSIGNFEMQMTLREYEHNIATSKLVIFDDISDVKASDYDNSYLYSWINTRMENGYSCIFTSNAETEEELLDIYQAKLIDRIFGYSKIVILNDGSNRTER